MLIKPTPDQQTMFTSFERLLEREVKPLAASLGEAPPSKAQANALLRALADFGVGKLFTPTEHGGQGADNVTTGLLIEALCKADGGLGGLASIQDGTTGLFARLASPALREKYLPRLLAGELSICMAITEPGVGSNPRDVRTRARRDGDHVVLSGEKVWISNADISDLAIIVCKLDGAPGLALILVDRGEGGYTSSNFKKLGLSHWPTGAIHLNDARVPAENVLSAAGAGLELTLRAFERARCFVGIISLGIAQAAFERAVSYAKERHQWGKPIGAHQSIQIKIAEMAVEIDAARLLVYRGLALLDQGERCDTQTAMAKLYASEMGARVASRAMEVMGAYGLSEEDAMPRLFRDARVMTVPDGTSDIQRLLIAKNITGLSAY
ncbi:MAG: acyl-CoA dehydrogenase family protein [Hyphomonadaceae bacterium]|nr:acyl-CoA dehydrogenase family protein [Hyphomonadaceae bacterium]